MNKRSFGVEVLRQCSRSHVTVLVSTVNLKRLGGGFFVEKELDKVKFAHKAFEFAKGHCEYCLNVFTGSNGHGQERTKETQQHTIRQPSRFLRRCRAFMPVSCRHCCLRAGKQQRRSERSH